jgi:hypothetical protein
MIHLISEISEDQWFLFFLSNSSTRSRIPTSQTGSCSSE